MSRVAVIGTTTWGVTLGVVLARNEVEDRLWARTEKESTKLKNGRYPSDVLSDVDFPPQLSITSSLDEALDDMTPRQLLVMLICMLSLLLFPFVIALLLR